MRKIILDTETTGRAISEGHRIIEIGCLELIDRRLTQRYFHCYLNPDRDSDAGALAVHGLTRQFLQDKPAFSVIVEELIAFIKGAELIIHNASFDLAFLDHEIKLSKKNYKKISDYCQILDTLPLARQLHPGQRNSLDALCKRYQVDNSKRERHGALLDAELLAQVYLAMTGGQTTLFDDKQIINAIPPFVIKKKAAIKALPVFAASIEELATHKRVLAKIKKNTGLCLWLSLDTQESH
jgi:DNA polymerase III subunit epsilon